MLLATLIWSLVCAATFLFAFHTGSRDYRTFFLHLLGRFWPIYEIAYLLALVLILAVFAAAAGAIGKSVFGLPELAGALARSEEHTSELQSLMRISYAVFCLKKKNTHRKNQHHNILRYTKHNHQYVKT